MRFPLTLIFAILLSLGLFSAPLSAEGSTEISQPSPTLAQPVADTAAFDMAEVLGHLWVFLNTPFGLAVAATIVGWISGWVFLRKPDWKKYVDTYTPLLIQAVKYAEKKIPDDVQSPGLRRLDHALQYVLKINPRLKEAPLRDALTAIHSEVEKNTKLQEVVLKKRKG